jgi:hypothetical protein
MRIVPALVMVIGLASPVCGQFSFAYRDRTFYSDSFQVVLNPAERPGIDKVTGFHHLLAENGQFLFFRAGDDYRHSHLPNKWTDVQESRTLVTLAMTGQIDAGGKKIALTQTVQAEPNGVHFTFQFDPAAVGKDKRGLLLFRLTEKAYQKGKFLIDGKDVLYATNPRTVSFGQTPCLDMGLSIQKAASVRMRRSPGASWMVELESTPEGQLDFTFLPPGPSVEITLSTDQYRNVFEDKQPVAIKRNVRLGNRLTADLPVTVTTTVTDYYGQTVYQDTSEKVLSAGKPDIQTMVPQLTKKGFYVVKTQVLDRKYNHCYTGVLTLGVIRPHPLDRPFKPTDYFGLFGISPAYDGGLAATLAKKIGAQWSRDECGWAYREPEKGKYDWRFTDNALAVTEKLKMGNMFLGEFPNWPMVEGVKWRPPVKDLDAWRTFSRLKAERYKGKGHAWEVTNEPYIGEMPVENCVKVHQIAMEEAKKVDPNTVILACVSCPSIFNYLQWFLKAGGAKACDGIAVHPYVFGGKDAPEAAALEEYQAAVRAEVDKYRPGMPVWWTEFSYAADDYEDRDLPDDSPEPMRAIAIPERLQANYCVRSHLIGLAGGVRHFIYFCFKAYNEKWHYNMVRQEGIKPIICAYNTMTWMLDGKEFEGIIKIEPKVYAMAFDGPNGNVLVYWYTGTPEKSGELSLPVKAERLEVVDLMDNRETIRAKGGRIILPIDGGPRFILSRQKGKTLLSTFAKATVELRANLK